jgi:hypothetical protein
MARVSLITIGMSRWTGVFAFAFTVAVFVLSKHGEAPAARQSSDSTEESSLAVVEPPAHRTQGTSPAPDFVRVHHELIKVAPPAGPRRPVRPAPRSPSVRDPERQPPFVERARRAFMGDGRYRPEPFPRPGTR